SVSFFRGWNDYRFGFGRADGEYWLGLQTLHLLTLQGRYELRVELEDFENNTAAATYGTFALSPHAISAEEDGYTLHVGRFVDGGAGRGAGGARGGGLGAAGGVGRGFRINGAIGRDLWVNGAMERGLGVNVGHWEESWGHRGPWGGS
uniref:Fibrinogen C-terminal domain-containing protein n=1 Tax=Cairina moschata TaxID=8855 RepID=A0A8C3BPF5_CAIMO